VDEFRDGMAKYAVAAAPPLPAAAPPTAGAPRAAPLRGRATVLAATRTNDDGEDCIDRECGDGEVLELTSLDELDALLARERLVMLKACV